MMWVRGIISVLKFLTLVGLVDYFAPGLPGEVGQVLGELLGEELHK